MQLGLEGRVALVSGGSRGIGRAVVDLLASEGARVCVAARSADGVESAVEAIRSAGGDAVGVAADLRLATGVAEAVDAAGRAFGPPDIAVANVISADPFNPLDADPAELAQAFQNMTVSVVHLARAVVPAMASRGWGRFVVLGAGLAKEPPPQLKFAPLAMTRAAAAVFVKSMANEVAVSGVTANTIGTGFIATDAMRELVDAAVVRTGAEAAAVWARFTGASPARRAGTPEEVAALVGLLCSEQGAFINGQFLAVDGGALRSTF